MKLISLVGGTAAAADVVVAEDVEAAVEEDAPLLVELLVEGEEAGVDEGLAETSFFFVLSTT